MRALLVALLCAGCGASLQDRIAGAEVVDLTHAMHDGMAFWPGGVPFKKTKLVGYDKGYLAHKFEMGENTGTHVDAPAHFIPGSPTIDKLAPRSLVVPAVVVDMADKADEHVDHCLSRDDLVAWEARHGRIPRGALVLLRTGWGRRFATPKRYVNADANGVMHFPGYCPGGARLLVERGVVGIGIDTLSIDPGESKDFAAHKIALRARLYQIENLANLEALPPTGAVVVVGVLPVRQGSQAQARVLALLPGR